MIKQKYIRNILQPNPKIITDFKILQKELFHELNCFHAAVREYNKVHFSPFLFLITLLLLLTLYNTYNINESTKKKFLDY